MKDICAEHRNLKFLKISYHKVIALLFLTCIIFWWKVCYNSYFCVSLANNSFFLPLFAFKVFYFCCSEVWLVCLGVVVFCLAGWFGFHFVYSVRVFYASSIFSFTHFGNSWPLPPLIFLSFWDANHIYVRLYYYTIAVCASEASDCSIYRLLLACA